jgi:sodium-coupled neutral amino acid transporter 11
MEGKPELPGSPDPSRVNVNKLEPIAVDDTNPVPPSNGRPQSPGLSNISMPEKKSGLIGASSNLVNSIVGAGIIGIPYAIRQSGIVVGIFLLVLVAYLTDKSLRIIIELACFHPKLKKLGVLTYGTSSKLLQKYK